MNIRHIAVHARQTSGMSDATQAALIAAGAALGSSVLTLTGTRWFDWRRDKRAAKTARAGARRALYVELLTATGAMLTNAAHLRSIADFTSKPAAPLNQILKRAPQQPTYMEIMELFHDPLRRLMNAWSDAYLVFDQGEIDAVNRLVDAAANVDPVALPDGSESGLDNLASARREFAAFARTRLGEEAVALAAAPPSAQGELTE